MSSSAGIPPPRPGSRDFLDTATADDLLARRGVSPGAPAGHQALSRLLQAAASSPGEQELAGEASFVAAFVMVTTTGESGRSAVPRPRDLVPRHARGPVSRRRQGLAAGIIAAAALVAAAGGTAAAGALPVPAQELAHVVFGAPAPHQASPLPGVKPYAPQHQQRTSHRTAVPGGSHGHGRGTGHAYGKSKAGNKASSKGHGHGTGHAYRKTRAHGNGAQPQPTPPGKQPQPKPPRKAKGHQKSAVFGSSSASPLHASAKAAHAVHGNGIGKSGK